MKLKHGAIGVLTICLLTITLAMGVAANDIDEYRSCNFCGMDRKAYGYSRMMVIYQDGGRVGVCSLQCAVTEMNEHRERAVTSLLVADRSSHAMIDAEKAVWVIGGSKRGVMTPNPKWAFLTRDAAQSFIGSYGGTIANWEATLRAARQEAAQPGNSGKK